MAREFTSFDELREAVQAGGVVLVDCYATWCGPCKMMAPVINELATEYEGKALVSKVDVDAIDSKSLGITAVPTLILYKDGKEVTRKLGFTSKAELQRLIDSNLQ